MVMMTLFEFSWYAGKYKISTVTMVQCYVLLASSFSLQCVKKRRACSQRNISCSVKSCYSLQMRLFFQSLNQHYCVRMDTG